MRIASFLHQDIQDAIALWLSSLGHQLSQHTDTAERLVTDYQHLQQLNTQNCTLEPQHWLLIDSQLSTTQTIQALQRGCGYISTAPLDKTTLKDWLAGTNPLPNMLAIDKQTLPTPEADPRLDQFIDIITTDLITKGMWTEELRQEAKRLIPYRDIGLQLPQFKHLKEEGKLTQLQQAQLACHTLAGAALLEQNQQPEAAQIALQHHEHFDGTGYPQQIKGDAIHPIARLAKLYDAYTGLRKEKAYAKAQSHEASVQKLQFGDGYLWPGQFEPQLLQSLVDNEEHIAQLF
jgi:HD-GYP domain-containing protein (c-di-GMP phosphodiesterase class II)